MEDILASIKRIIAEDGAAVPVPRARRSAEAAPPKPAADPVRDTSEILELTNPVPIAPPAKAKPARPTEPVASVVLPTAEAVTPEPATDAAPLVSEGAAAVSRQALDTLSAMVVRGPCGQDNTLDSLMRELLRPMLKDWQDARLPEIVETLVAQEIARISGKAA